KGAEGAIDLPPHARLTRRGPRLQPGNVQRARSRVGLLDQIRHVSFRAADGAVHEEGVDAVRGKPRREIDCLNRRSADVQPRDDSGDAQAATIPRARSSLGRPGPTSTVSTTHEAT